MEKKDRFVLLVLLQPETNYSFVNDNRMIRVYDFSIEFSTILLTIRMMAEGHCYFAQFIREYVF